MTHALKPADAAFAEALASRLSDGVLSEAGPAYLTEPRARWTGPEALLARPRTTQEVSVILAACHAAGVPVIPRGGGTGLVGGQIREQGPRPLILSVERMTAVRGVWPEENAITVEAGLTLAEVHEAAEGAGRIFPLTLASQGTARIGGTLATNAGGVNVLRYGTARDLCLGIEAVLADGTVIHGLKRLRKDNTGYDLRHLLIGAEGTLGVITAASLKLHPLPAGEGTALMVVRDPAAALTLLSVAEAQCAGCVSAFELINGQGLAFLSETMPDLRQPFATVPEWMVLVELGLPAGLDPEAALASIFETGLEQGLVSDGLIAQSLSQRQDFWHLRESIPEGNRRIGAIASHDISVPLSEIPGFIERARRALAEMGDYRINCFGHVGDGNLHFNAFPAPGRHRDEYDNERRPIMDCVHALVHDCGGSVSAEHGVGRLKTSDIRRFGDPGRLAAMAAIKAALDPRGIMNPGAVLD